MKKLLSLLLAAVIITVTALSLSSCGITLTEDDLRVLPGACVYTETKDTTGHELRYAMLTVKDYGSLILLLDATVAPITVDNFMTLVNEGFYNGLTFHRVMNNFMIQGGCPKGDGTGDSGKDIFGEFADNGYYNNLLHKDGVISMARNSGDNNSASSQFFICNSDSANVKNLNGSYAAFGWVIAGLDVVDYVTSYTASYGDSNGAIRDKSKQAVIARIIEITEDEALSYVKTTEN